MTNDTMTHNTFTEFKFDGFKNSEIIICNSQMLLNYLVFLEWDSTVESYFQPLMSVEVDYQNIEYQAKIDLWINYQNGKTELIHFLDRKWMELISDHPMLYARFERFCRSCNLKYVPITTLDTDCDPLLPNLNLLWRNARHELRPTHVVLVNNFFAREKATTLGKLRQVLTEAGFSCELAYTLIFHKLVLADILHFPLAGNTTILPGHVYPGAEIIPPVLVVEKLNSKVFLAEH